MKGSEEDEQLDPKRAADIIRDQFPEVRPANVSYLGEGYDSTAFEVNGEWVFRFPKRDEVEQQLLLELNVLPVLADGSPLSLPTFRFRGEPSGEFPRRFVGYPKIPGVPAIGLDPDAVPVGTWGPRLAEFLSWLHGVPVDEAARLGVERVDGASLIAEFQEDALSEFENLKRVASDEPLDEWHAYLAAGVECGSGPSAAPVFVHGDLAAEHVLFDPTTHDITGVIDWSEMAICDRALDLAAVFHWGGRPFAEAVLATYTGPVDDTVLRRAAFLAACRGVADVTFGLETGRREYVEGGLRALTLATRNSRRAGG